MTVQSVRLSRDPSEIAILPSTDPPETNAMKDVPPPESDVRWTGADAFSTAPLAKSSGPEVRAVREHSESGATPGTKPRFRLVSGGPGWFGRVGGKIAVLGAILGAMLGDPGATTNKAPDPVPICAAAPASPSPRREASYVGDAVRRASGVLASLGLDSAELFSLLTDVSLSVQVGGADSLRDHPSSRLKIRPGTRVTSRIDRQGLSVDAEPKLGWRVDWSPDAELERLRYDFASGRFDVDASGVGPDAIYHRIVTDKANKHLRAQLPCEMRRPGYDPWSDRRLESNLQALIDLVRTAAPEGAHRDGLRIDRLSSPRVALSFRVPKTKIIPVEGGFSARLEAGTLIDLHASFSGPNASPKLEVLTIDFSRPLDVARGDGEHRSVLQSIDISSLTLSPGGQIDLTYRLGVEEVADGVKDMIALFAKMAEPRANVGHLRETRLEGVRKIVQERVDGVVEPRLREAIRQNDGAVPGLSLIDVFGLSANELQAGVRVPRHGDNDGSPPR